MLVFIMLITDADLLVPVEEVAAQTIAEKTIHR
jgi:hypothetical protein